MPHKHTRKGENKLTTDLPPTVVAKPLSVSKFASANGIFTSEVSDTRKSNKRNRNSDKNDDTPKAFARLMAFREGKKLPKGLDDGVKPTKKQKRAMAAANSTSTKVEVQILKPEMPKIQPGERMSEFSARVDAAIPISGLINKTARRGKDPLGLKVGRTKKERKMHRIYDEWREQEKRIKERREEALELAQEEDEDEDGATVKWKVDMEAAARESKKNGKGKKKRVLGEVDDGEGDDPWAAVAKARNEGPRRLNDVAQAPPQFTKVPSDKFKLRGARVDVDDVPKASGSLRRREELGEVRKSVVEGYRQMMKANKISSRQRS